MLNCNNTTDDVPKRKQFETHSRGPQFKHAHEQIAQTEVLYESANDPQIGPQMIPILEN